MPLVFTILHPLYPADKEDWTQEIEQRAQWSAPTWAACCALCFISRVQFSLSTWYTKMSVRGEQPMVPSQVRTWCCRRPILMTSKPLNSRILSKLSCRMIHSTFDKELVSRTQITSSSLLRCQNRDRVTEQYALPHATGLSKKKFARLREKSARLRLVDA